MHWVAALSLCLSAQAPAGAGRTLRTYDVRFLTESVPQFPAPSWPTAGDLVLQVPADEEEAGSPIAFTSIEAREESSDVAPPGRGIPEATLVDLVKRNVAEDSWANDLNSIRAEHDELIVVQTPEVHDEIARLLAALGARRARVVTVEVVLVPVAALGAAADLASPWIPAADLDTALERAGKAGMRIALTAYNEQRMSGFTGRRTSRVVDQEVNQTGVIPVVNPVVESIPLGVTAEVFPSAIGETGWFRLDLRVARLKEAGAALRRTTIFGDLELLPLDEESLTTTLLLEPARAAIAGTFHSEGEGGEKRDFAVLARLGRTELPAGDSRAPAEPDAFQLRVQDVGFLLEPMDDESPFLSPESLVQAIEARADPEAWRDNRASISLDEGDRLLHVTARAATHAKVKAFLDGLVAERGRVATVETREIEGPLEDLLAARRAAEGGVFLPPGWPGADVAGRAHEVFRAACTGVVGSRMRARGFDAQRFVAEYSTVSGGTGFSVLNMPDPVIRSAGGGFTLAARCDATGAPEVFGLDLDLERCRTRLDRTAQLMLALDLGHVGGSPPPDSKTPAPPPATRKQAWEPFIVDLPSQTRLSRSASVALAAGRPAILRIEDAGGGRGRIVITTVRVAGAIPPPAAATGAPAPAPAARADEVRRELRAFDLRFLTAGPRTGGSTPAPPRLITPQESWRREDSPAVVRPSPAPWRLAEAEDGLMDLVKSFIDPDSWRNARNEAQAAFGRITIKQTPEVLARIDSFLTLVQSRAARIAVVDLALVPQAALEKAAPGSTAPGASPWLPEDALEKAAAAAGADAVVLSTLAREGALAVVSPRSVAMRVGDYEVNQTGVLPVVNPVIAASRDGAFAEVAVFGAPAGEWFRADVRVGLARIPREPERRRLPYGDLDLPDLEHVEVTTCCAVPAGRTVLLGFFTRPAAGDRAPGQLAASPFAAVLRVRRAAPIAAPAALAAEVPRAIDVALLLAGHPHAHDRHDVEVDSPQSDPGVFDPDILESTLAGLLGGKPDADGPRPVQILGGTAFVRGGDAEAGKVRDQAEKLARVSLGPVTIDLIQANASAQELKGLPRGAVLDAPTFDKLSARPSARLRVVSATGTLAAIVSAAARSFLGDVDMVSGGTGFDIGIAADPSVQSAGTGVSLQIQCDLVQSSPLARLSVNGMAARPPIFSRQAKARINLDVEMPKAAGEGPTPAGDWILLDLPDEDVDRWVHHVTVPIGRPFLLSALPDASAPGETRVLVAVVRDAPLPQ